MSYKINPAKAAFENTKNIIGNVNKANSICYNVAKNYDLSDEVTKNFCNIVTLPHRLDKYQKSGRTPCSYKIKKSVSWNNVPSYFPSIYAETRDKEKSLKLCKQKCLGKNDCKEMCMYDKSAIIENDIPIKENFVENKKPCNCNQNSNEMYLWISIALVLIISILISFLLLSKNKNNF